MTYLLAVDGGSQSTKVTVVDETGRVHASGRVALRPYDLGPDGRAVHPDDDLWDSLVGACRESLAAFPGSPEEIAAVGLCGIRSCRALLDAGGRLTEPLLSWMDPRVARRLPAVGPEVATVTSAGGYLTVRLTGRRRDSAAAYAGMWPLDPATGRWSSDPAEADRTGLPAHLLPELVDPGEVLGALTSDAAAALGLVAGCPVVATANDKAVEALGCGVTAPGTLLLSLGTYVTAMTVADDVPADDDRVWRNAAAVPGRHLAESEGIRRGMWTVSWLRALVGGEPHPGDVDDLEIGAGEVPPGCGGLVTLPDWLAPDHAPHRRGAILGLDASMGRHHLYRSLLEGIAITMHGHVERMESALGARSPRLVLSGGGSRSPLLRRIVADVFARPVEQAGLPDAAGLGAAICAAVGSGVHPTFDDAVTAMVHPGPTTDPDDDGVRRYVDVAATYAALREPTDQVLLRLAATGRSPRGDL